MSSYLLCWHCIKYSLLHLKSKPSKKKGKGERQEDKYFGGENLGNGKKSIRENNF